ncbi:MAG: hypothetical protein HY775_12650 [Acidobacteria bacterium]|nr:hypothetical protein [Acidobacteriota bacterium]
MRFAVEAWAPDYGAPIESETLEPSGAAVDVSREVPAERWSARRPPDKTVPPSRILFIDGVRRIDAGVWIHSADGVVRPGICASFAAGAVRCDGRASLADARVERGLFCAAPDAERIETPRAAYQPRAAQGESAESLSLALQRRMGELEVQIALGCEPADLIVVDGPLRGRQNVPGAIGYVKTHQVSYLPPVVSDVVAELAEGERTPVFFMTSSWSRFSWYLRLPGASGHPWAGVVRCEAGADLDPRGAAALADVSALVLPRFASRAHKDPRAPQNLYPIAGLERELRRRLGDPALLYRALRGVAHGG